MERATTNPLNEEVVDLEPKRKLSSLQAEIHAIIYITIAISDDCNYFLK